MASSLEGAIFGIGNPLLDISANVNMAVLDKYGLKESTAILAEEKHLPLYEELVADHAVQYIAGGAAQNTIRAAQWMLQDIAPGATNYTGCVGSDAYAEQLENSAREGGVQVHYLKNASFPTGTCAVLVTHSDRSLVANLGAANHYSKDHFDSEPIQKLVHQAKIFYAAGFFLTVSPDTLISIGEHAVRHNKVFSFNISAEFLVHVFGTQLDSVLPYVDVLFANEVETHAYGQARGWGSDLKVITQKLAKLDKVNKQRERIVVTTQGPGVAFVSIGGADCLEFPALVVPADELVDVNGAGDAFVGGFLAYHALNSPLATCMAAGHHAASLCVRQSGARFPGKPGFAPSSP